MPANPHPENEPNAARLLPAIAGLVFALVDAIAAAGLARGGHRAPGALLGAVALVAAAFSARQGIRWLARCGVLGRWQTRIDYEFTREGAVYLLTTGLVAIASVNTGNNLLFMVLALLLAGMLVSGILSKMVLTGLKLDLTMPEHIFAGQPVRARLTLSNGKRFVPSYSLTLRLAGRRTALRAPRSAEADTVKKSLYAPYIPAGGCLSQELDLCFRQRGRYHQDAFEVSTKFPFSVLRRKRPIGGASDILVLPAIGFDEQFAGTLSFLGGEIPAARKGHGSDLYGLRSYQDGDGANRVDWKATAKTRRLTVREFACEEESRLTLIFDARVPDESDEALERFERAIRRCALIAWQLYCDTPDRSWLQFIGGNLRTRMARATGVVFPLLEELAVIEPILADQGGDAAALARSAEGLPVVVTSLPAHTIVENVPEDAHVLAEP